MSGSQFGTKPTTVQPAAADSCWRTHVTKGVTHPASCASHRFATDDCGKYARSSLADRMHRSVPNESVTMAQLRSAVRQRCSPTSTATTLMTALASEDACWPDVVAERDESKKA